MTLKIKVGKLETIMKKPKNQISVLVLHTQVIRWKRITISDSEPYKSHFK